MDIPGTITDIDLNWLRQALNCDQNLTGYSSERIGQGIGLLSLVYRIRLEYAEQASLPASVVIKLCSDDEETLTIAATFDFYSRECSFYQSLGHDHPLQPPACFHQAIDASRTQFVIVMEDLQNSSNMDQLKGATEQQAQGCIDALANSHASAESAQEPWMYPFANLVAPMAATYPQIVPLCFDILEMSVAPATIDCLTKTATNFATLAPQCINTFPTFLHGDFRLDNLVLDADNGVRALDWGSSCSGPGLWDVSMYLSSSVDTALRRRIEKDLVRRYHDSLQQYGITQLTFAECWLSYRQMMACTFYVAATVATRMTMENQRGAALSKLMLERAVAAIDDHVVDQDVFDYG